MGFPVNTPIAAAMRAATVVVDLLAVVAATKNTPKAGIKAIKIIIMLIESVVMKMNVSMDEVAAKGLES